MRSHLWLLERRTFQTPFDKAAPLDKVTSAIAYPTTTVPDDAGYRQPARANTIFPFRFILPSDAGSAVEFAQDARTRYTLTGYAKVRILGSFETLVHSIEVFPAPEFMRLGRFSRAPILWEWEANLEVDVVEQLPWDHIYRNPEYKYEEIKVKDSTEKSMSPMAERY